MLQELTVRSFALIDELTLQFGPRLTIITGETGSGKSILIDALGLALGERASAQDVVRSGADRCVVEAVFSLDDAPAATTQFLRDQELIEAGSSLSEPLIVSRELTVSGKNTARVNGRLMPVSSLRAATAGLVDIHGQSEHQSLLVGEHHIELLDRWLGERALACGADVRQKYQAASALRRSLAELRESARMRAQNLDLYRFQKDEIDSAAIGIGEDEQLQQEKTRLANAEKLRAIADTAHDALSQQALDGLNGALYQVERAVLLDPALEQSAGLLRDALSSAEDANRALRAYRERIEFDPGRLEEIDDRLDLLRGLKRKYGETLDEVLAYAHETAAKLDLLENSDAAQQRLEAELAGAEAALAGSADALSQVRRDGSRAFAEEVVRQLQDLGMAQCLFEVSIARAPIGPTGQDSVRFLVSPNVGEPLRPLAKVASGGELSRLMLALKTVLAKAHTVPTLIFDEIDVGVGGRTAQAIGRKLLALSGSAQVFCITHLPQIASLPADLHIAIEKRSDGARTMVTIEALGAEGRVAEIARMLGGRGESSVVLEHAKELLASGSSA